MESAMPFQRNIDEISNNPFFVALSQLCVNYGLPCRYLSMDGGFSDENKGVYFITGIDEWYIYGDNVNINVINNLSRDMPAMFVPTAICTPLDEVQPYANFVMVAEFCKNVEAMREGWKIAEKPMPRMMTMSGMETLKACFEAMKTATPRQKEQIKDTIREVIDRESPYIDPTHPDYKKKKYELKYYDWGKGKFGNWWRRTFRRRHPNKMSLESLAYRTPTTLYKIVVPDNKTKREMKKMLKEHPEILYAQDKTRGIRGARYTTFYFEERYERDIECLLNRNGAEDSLHTTPDRLLAEFGSVCDITIPNGEYPDFSEFCKQNRIKFCADEKYKELQANCINLVFPAKHRELVNAYLERRATEHANAHVVPNEKRSQFVFPSGSSVSIDRSYELTKGRKTPQAPAKQTPQSKPHFPSNIHQPLQAKPQVHPPIHPQSNDTTIPTTDIPYMDADR